jgi:hypothetical protein
MTRIVGADGLSLQDVEEEVLAGARFVVFSTCVSMILVTQRRAGDVHFVRADDPFPKAGLRAMGLTLLLGWWGIPWGPFHTVGALATNLKGGLDVTRQVMAQLTQAAQAASPAQPA